MTEKNKEKMTNTSKPVPMKLFAAWEVDRTPSNCIPRLCTLRITSLRVCAPIGEAGGGAVITQGGGAVILAARMHSSKRTLRSNDIVIPPNDVELDLCFSLQYPHFVKRDGNRLQIMLQRRKKYKNRTILGYKTLAEGVIRMDQVLQRSMDMELELTGVGGKGCAAGGQPVARLTITGLASTPVDHDTKNNNTLLITERGYSDEEEEGEFSSVEETEEMTYGAPRRRAHRQLVYNKSDLSYTKLARSREMNYLVRERSSYIGSKANDRDSDSELEVAAAKRKGSRGILAQRNLKQKFAALLRRFRPDELAERGATRHPRDARRDIHELFQELESLSCGEGEDSGPDQMDTISIGSTPKPSLRPFFSSSRSLANQDHHRHSNVVRHSSLASASELAAREQQLLIVPPESEPLRSSAGDERGSDGNSDGDAAPVASGASVSSSPPREVKEDKRSRLFRSATSGGNLTPAAAGAGARKKNSLSIHERPLSAHDFPQSPTALEPRKTIMEQVTKLLGEDGPLPEAVGIAPTGAIETALQSLGVACVGVASVHAADVRALMQVVYSRSNKLGGRGRGCRVVVCGESGAAAAAVRAHAELSARRPDLPPRVLLVPTGPNVICRHLCSLDSGYAALFGGDAWASLVDKPDCTGAQLAELTCRIARYVNASGGVMQVPLGEAMVACRDKATDDDSNQTFVPFVAEVRVGWSESCVSSLEGSEGGSPPARASPPATPAPAPPVTHDAHKLEPLELQLDYWPVPGRQTEGADGGKVTIKASFRVLQVTRQNAHLCINYLTKEKKQKIMRLGKKKEKANETETGRMQTVDGVARLICSAKGSHNVPLKVYIDGTEWNGVKFFQLSTQWQTHVKTFPVVTTGGAPLAPPET